MELREKAIPHAPLHPPHTHTNEVYYVLLLRCIQKYCNVMEKFAKSLDR